MATLIAMLIRLRAGPLTIVFVNKRGGARAIKTPQSRIAAATSHRLVTGLLRSPPLSLARGAAVPRPSHE
jgi:hypothetical protein